MKTGEAVFIKRPFPSRYVICDGAVFPENHEGHWGILVEGRRINKTDHFDYWEVDCNCGEKLSISEQFLAYPPSADNPTCWMIGCMSPAKFVTIETLPQWICCNHAANWIGDVYLVTLDRWRKILCPWGGVAHAPHVGCDYLISGVRYWE